MGSGITYAYADLKAPPFPAGVDVTRREQYLSEEEFLQVHPIAPFSAKKLMMVL